MVGLTLDILLHIDCPNHAYFCAYSYSSKEVCVFDEMFLKRLQFISVVRPFGMAVELRAFLLIAVWFQFFVLHSIMHIT